MAATYHPLMARPTPALLSLVVPLYNEQEVVPLLRKRLESLAGGIGVPVEFVLVNDGSSDRTLDGLLAWAATDVRVRVVALARNFGHQIAATAGLDAARGDAVVLMDADLQDPPEVVPAMVALYCEGGTWCTAGGGRGRGRRCLSGRRRGRFIG